MIVSIGISALMDSFHVSETAAQWVSTAYLLALAIVIPRSAEERFGGRRCWMAGLLLFLAVLGGIVLSITSWHWLFLINIPVGLIAIFISAR